MKSRCARRCLRCRGRGGWFKISPKLFQRIMGFNPIGGWDMLLHAADGSVASARYVRCPKCLRRGMRVGERETLDDVVAWAERAGFVWPEIAPASLTAISGCIETAPKFSAVAG